MLVQNGFTVEAPVDFLWAYLLDVEKIAPCMPGAELTEIVDDSNWKGKLNAKFGPVSLSFAGTVTMDSRDDSAHRVVLTAKGTEQKGKGAATAKVTSWLEPGSSPGETVVKMEADITITGAAAQLSRGLLPEISKKLTQAFADCLKGSMAEEQAAHEGSVPAADAPEPSRPSAAQPVGGIGLGLSAIWSIVVGFFRKLFGGKHPSSQ